MGRRKKGLYGMGMREETIRYGGGRRDYKVWGGGLEQCTAQTLYCTVHVLRKSTHGYCFLFKHVKLVHTTVNTSTNTCMYYEITNNTHMLLPWLPRPLSDILLYYRRRSSLFPLQ